MEPPIPYVAYKATYNFKCRDQVYHVGKTYISRKLQMCAHGIHFCLNMQDTIKFYEPTDKFVLLEIAVLGTVQTDGCKSVTDKIKVLRVVHKEEYTKQMLDAMTAFEYDDHGNLIKETHNDFEFYTYTYDERGNKLTMTDQDGDVWKYEYDDRGNMIVENDTKMEYDDHNQLVRKTFPSGNFITYTYDERGNKIATKDNRGYHTTLEYDELNRLTKQTYAINELNRQINYTTPTGWVCTFEYANVTEED